MMERTYTADEVDAMIARAVARERLEQPNQEPLGYIASMAANDLRASIYRDVAVSVYGEDLEDTVAIYTTPPAAQRQWVGLTAGEMEGLYQSATYMDETDHIHMLMLAEAKLKEKNT